MVHYYDGGSGTSFSAWRGGGQIENNSDVTPLIVGTINVPIT